MTDRTQRAGFRADVEGLRAVAILMVAVYHVWVGRVSGGVDIFLMISGFFVGASLVRTFIQGRSLALGLYLQRIFRRLVPPAVVVLATVLVVTFVLLPRTSMSLAAKQSIASMFYVENWYLATSGRAYGAADASQSPFQHFWSLSVQGQLYILVPMLLIIATVIFRSKVSRRLYLGVIVALLVTSFTYAALRVTINQPVAYYDTLARAWQYLLGTVLAFVAVTGPVARLGYRVRSVLGVTGAVMILVTGVLIDGLTLFPGPAALIPLLGAAAVLVAGAGERPTLVTRFLSWRPLVAAGGYAYPFYLWHWPVLVVAIALLKVDHVSWATGTAVLLVSGGLAWLTQELLSRRAPIARRAIAPHPSRRLSLTGIVGGVAVTTVLLGSLSWTGYVAYQRNAVDTAGSLDPWKYPGARSLIDPSAWPVMAGVDTQPSPLIAQLDWPTAGHDECWTGSEDEGLSECSFGAPDGDLRVALVGGSHSMGLLLPVVSVAEGRSLQVSTYFKQACPLRLEVGEVSTCATWSDTLIDHLVASRYDAVILVGTRPAIDGPGDFVPDSYLRAWLPLLESGTPVIAVRDNPWLPFNGPECVETSRLSIDCTVDERQVLARTNPLEGPVAEYPLLQTIDMSDLFCVDGTCSTVIGNILAYIDDNHITAAYSRTLSSALDVRLGNAMGWW